MIQANLSKEDGILRVTREGEITIPVLVDYIQDVDRKCKHLEKVFILDRIGNSQTLIKNIDQLDVLIQEIAKRISGYKLIKHALLVDQPLETAIVYLFQQVANAIDIYRVEIFSTEQAARVWLRSS